MAVSGSGPVVHTDAMALSLMLVLIGRIEKTDSIMSAQSQSFDTYTSCYPYSERRRYLTHR